MALPEEAPAVPLHTRTGKAKAGTQYGRMIPCELKPDNHGFHPEYEDCPYCLETRHRGWW